MSTPTDMPYASSSLKSMVRSIAPMPRPSKPATTSIAPPTMDNTLFSLGGAGPTTATL